MCGLITGISVQVRDCFSVFVILMLITIAAVAGATQNSVSTVQPSCFKW